MSKFRIVIYPGKYPHFKTSLLSFDKDALVLSKADPLIIDTKLTEKELQSLTSVKLAFLLDPPPVLSCGLSLERLVLDIFSIPKNSKIVKLKDLDNEIFRDITYKFELYSSGQYCILENSRMSRTDLESFFNDAISRQSVSTQNEIKIIFYNSDTGLNHQILSNSLDHDYLYLEFRSSQVFNF